MAIDVTCPSCDADYSVPENLVGKSIRCKKCSETIAVKKPARVAAKATVEDDERPRKVTRRREEDDDDYDDRRPAKKSGVSPMLIGGIAALVLALGGVGAYFALAGDAKKDQAQADPAPAARSGTPAVEPGPSEEGRPVVEKKDEPKKDEVKKDEVKAAEPKKEDLKAAEPKKTTEPVTTTPEEPKKPVAKDAPPKTDNSNRISDKPVQGVATAPGGSDSGMSYEQFRSGDLSPSARAKVKAASVYIFCEAGGGAGTGSGWFGVEPGLVFTNAHVLHMTAPNAPKPKKITFFLNAGTPEQREIPHAKIEILAVDHDIDLAVLRVNNEPNLPPPLKVRPSLECGEGLKLQTVGYPFGARVGGLAGTKKEPEVSIRPTQITSYRRNDFGIIRRIQLEGAANPGNSGGPVVDAEGTVCTVIVQGFHGTGSVVGGIALTFGVPTEYCFGILAGRISDVQTEIAYKDGDKVRIPIKVKCLDPVNRLKSVGIASWVGNPSTKYRSPGAAKPKEEPGDRDYTEVMLKYDSKTKMAIGEVVLPATKPDGTVYWIQPFYSNSIITRYWQPGAVYNRKGDAAERVPANLVAKPTIGKTRTVKVTSADGKFEAAEGEGQDKNDRQMRQFGLTMNEDMHGPDANDPVQIARGRYKFLEMAEPKAVVGQIEEQMMPKTIYNRINEEVKKCGGVGLFNKEGELYKQSVNTIQIQHPVIKFYADLFTKQTMEGLRGASVTMPNRTVQPGETWNNTEEVPVIVQDPPPTDEEGNLVPGAQIPAPRNYRYQLTKTFKYIGTRTRNGRVEALIMIEGKVEKSPGTSYSAFGSVVGHASIEIDSGMVLESFTEVDWEVDTSSKGIKKSAFGLSRYRVERSAPN